MKKKQLKKLQLSRETLRELSATEARKAAGGSEVGGSCQSNMRCLCITDSEYSGDPECIDTF
jgi:hypothetical protein